MNNRKLKILQVIDYFSPKLGGPVHNIYNLSVKLKKFGHDVTVCSSDFQYDPAFPPVSSGIDVKIFPCVGPFKYSPAMKGWLEKNISGFDVAHANNYWNYQNVVLRRAAVKNHVPYIISPRGSLPIQMKSFLIKSVFDRYFGQKVLDSASVIIGTTGMEVEQILAKKQSREKAMLIPNAVNLPPKDLDSPADFRDKYGIPEGDDIILFFGRIHKIKGVDLLAEAFSRIARSRKNVTLVVAGPDDGMVDDIKRIVSDNGAADKVVFTGPLYGRDKYSAYSAATVYVLPSRYEIFGNTILEACSCSVPVVITDRCGIAPVIAGRAGEVVGFEIDAVSGALDKLLNDPELRRRYGMAGRRIVEDDYTWDKIAGQFENVYRSVIEKNKKRD